jgi:V-type H+-transporting ATPase subunit d
MASALIFNENEGYVDGILRGYYSGILNSSQYLNFTQCETLEGKIKQNIKTSVIIECCLYKDLRLQLGATDYGSLLQNEPSPIATSTISEKLTQSLVDEFQYIRSNAVQPLSKFLDYIT